MDWAIVRAEEVEDHFNVARFVGSFRTDLRVLRSLGRELLCLGDICADSSCGATPKGSAYSQQGVPLLRGQNIREAGISWDGIARFDCDDPQKLGRRLVRDNDVLLTMSGANAGDVCCAEQLPEPCSLSNTVMRFAFGSSDDWDPRFITIFLQSRLGRAQFERVLSGMAQKHVMPNIARRTLIPRASRVEQQIIVDRYNEVVTQVTKLSESAVSPAETVSRLLQNIDSAFRTELGLPDILSSAPIRSFVLPPSDQDDRLDVNFNQPLRRGIRDRLRECQRQMLRLGDIAEIENRRLPSDEMRGYVGLEHIEQHVGRFVPGAPAPVEGPVSAANEVLSKRLLYGRLRPYLNKVVWVDCIEKGIGCSTEIWVTKLLDESRGRVLAAYLRSSYGLTQLMYLSAGGTLPRVQEDDFCGVLVPQLEETEVLRLADQLTHCEQVFDRLHEAVLKQYEVARDIIDRAKANLFDLLDDHRFYEILSMADGTTDTVQEAEVAR